MPRPLSGAAVGPAADRLGHGCGSSKPLRTSNPAQRLGATAWNGDTPPDNPVLNDIDGIEPAHHRRALHSTGDYVICYIEVGSW